MQSPKQKRLNILGCIILAAGFCLGGLVYLSGGPGPDAVAEAGDASTLMETKKAYRAVEMYNGRLGLVANNVSDLWQQWKHPRPIGITIAGASAFAALCTFVLAWSWREPED